MWQSKEMPWAGKTKWVTMWWWCLWEVCWAGRGLCTFKPEAAFGNGLLGSVGKKEFESSYRNRLSLPWWER